MVLDIIFVALVVLAFIIGLKQGFIKSVWKIGAWIVTGFAVYAALNPAANFLHGTQLADGIYNSIYNTLSGRAAISESASLSEMTSLPEWIAADVDNTVNNAAAAVNDGIENAVQNTSSAITDVLIKIIAAVSLFVLIRLVLAVLFIVVNGAAKLPVVSGVNRLLGALFSVVNVLLGIYLAAAIAALFANPSIYEYINGTYIVKYLFNNNILMQLFMSL